jgi:hypothetical protein
MASRKTYTCFVCQKAGHEVQVFLDGKDEQGHTKYLNEDMTKHTHLGSSSNLQQPPQSQQQASTTIVTQSTKEDRILNLLGDLTIKINRVIKLLED